MAPLSTRNSWWGVGGSSYYAVFPSNVSRYNLETIRAENVKFSSYFSALAGAVDPSYFKVGSAMGDSSISQLYWDRNKRMQNLSYEFRVWNGFNRSHWIWLEGLYTSRSIVLNEAVGVRALSTTSPQLIRIISIVHHNTSIYDLVLSLQGRNFELNLP